MEEAYLEPRIVVYYDVISEKEIETVKRLGQPKVTSTSMTASRLLIIEFSEIQFKTATFYNARTGRWEPRGIRTSKVGWLVNDEHQHVADVSRA